MTELGRARNMSLVARLGRLILPLLALDIPYYREIFSRSIAGFSTIFRLPALNVEMYLRGLTYKSVSHGRKILVGRYVILNPGDGVISIGENSLINNFCYLTAHRAGGAITIGQSSHLDVFCSLHGQGGISIGDGCAIASNVTIYSQTNQYISSQQLEVIDQDILFARVQLDDHVWVGAGAVILPGVHIGQGAIIGAGAVVTSDIPDYAVAVGVPARVIKANWKKN